MEHIRRWWPPLVLGLLCLLPQAMGWEVAWRYERELLDSEPWRLATGHLVHLGWVHLGMNLAGLLLIWALFAGLLPLWCWAMGLLLSALGVSLGLYLFDPALAWYVGLSGVLHGLLAMGALALLRRDRVTAMLLLVGVVGKLLWEQLGGGDAGSAELIGGAVIVNAHLYGALAGLALAPLLWWRGA